MENSIDHYYKVFSNTNFYLDNDLVFKDIDNVYKYVYDNSIDFTERLDFEIKEKIKNSKNINMLAPPNLHDYYSNKINYMITPDIQQQYRSETDIKKLFLVLVRYKQTSIKDNIYNIDLNCHISFKKNWNTVDMDDWYTYSNRYKDWREIKSLYQNCNIIGFEGIPHKVNFPKIGKFF